MFNKNEFSKILKNINEIYENQTYFSQASGANRTYLSQYMNQKLDNPPSPKVLHRIAIASKGLYSYMDLMQTCGYINYNESEIKKELEEELKKFDLSENELVDVINCFMHDSEEIQALAFSLTYAPNYNDSDINKEKQILQTVLKYVLKFIPNDLDVSSDREKFYNEFTKALEPAKKMLLNLDKTNIVNNDYSKNVMDIAKEINKLDIEQQNTIKLLIKQMK